MVGLSEVIAGVMKKACRYSLWAIRYITPRTKSATYMNEWSNQCMEAWKHVWKELDTLTVRCRVRHDRLMLEISENTMSSMSYLQRTKDECIAVQCS